VIGEGALLGDRATMINSQDDRVFMRSMATRGQAGGLSPATEAVLRCWRIPDSTTSSSKPSEPGRRPCHFATNWWIKPYCNESDYGARLQLQKIVMLDVADIVVVNKTDLERAKAALSEIQQRLSRTNENRRSWPRSPNAIANPGVDELFELITKENT